MAKPQDDVLVQEDPATKPTLLSASAITFRDTLYTSRMVILPDDRTLAVAGGVVSISGTDEIALKCLKAHPEFEPHKE